MRTDCWWTLWMSFPRPGWCVYKIEGHQFLKTGEQGVDQFKGTEGPEEKKKEEQRNSQP